MRTAKTLIRLGGCPSLCAQWVAKDLSFLHADSEDSDQTGRMPRLVWVFGGRIGHFVGFVMRRLIWAGAKKKSMLGIRSVCSKFSLCAFCVAKYQHLFQADSIDWTDWVDTQADLKLHWEHLWFYQFCRVPAHILVQDALFQFCNRIG